MKLRSCNGAMLSLIGLLPLALGGCGAEPSTLDDLGPGRGSTLASPEAFAQARALFADVVQQSGVEVEFASTGEMVALVGRRSGDAPANVVLPASADGPVTLAELGSGMRLRFALAEARPVRATLSEGAAYYPAAVGDAGHLLLRPTENGLEDWIAFTDKPPVEEIRYRLELEAVAGLRLVADTLELLDADGAPRLRVSPPHLVDAQRRRHAARIALDGCRADDDPRAPWGRPVTPPGAAACTLRVVWGATAGQVPVTDYPVLLDPLWSTTGSMASARAVHQLTLLASGQVLATGGMPTFDPTPALASAELYDPATGTWAATGSMTEGRQRFAQARLDDGRVLVAGGCTQAAGLLVCDGSATSTAELYDPTLGTFTAVGSLSVTRSGAGLAALGDGRAIVFGGSASPTSEIFDAKTATFSPAASLASGRGTFGFGRVVADGKVRVVVAGGVLLPDPQITATSEVYLPEMDEWIAVNPLSVPRSRAEMFVLPDGRALFVGGINPGGPQAAIDAFDPVTLTWSPLPSLVQPRHSAVAGALPSGRLLVVGGCCEGPPTTVEVLDAEASGWQLVGGLTPALRFTAAVQLADGRILVTGGAPPGSPPTGAAVVFDDEAQGSTCTEAAECATGHCVDGFCCDSACGGGCTACSAAAKGQGEDGVCGPVIANLPDPRQICVDQGASSCGATGQCDGSGSCSLYAVGTVCTAASCPAGESLGACDGSGTCVCPGLNCNGARLENFEGVLVEDCSPYFCVGDACRTSCNSSDDCVDGFLCDAGQTCVTASHPSGSGGSAPVLDPEHEGCGCRAPGPAPRLGAGAIALALLSALVLARSRRRR